MSTADNSKEAATVRAAALELHEQFCGCDAAPDDWCDSLYLVVAERVAAIFSSSCDHEWDDHWMVQYMGLVPQYEVRYCLKCSEPERRMYELPIMRASGPVGFRWGAE